MTALRKMTLMPAQRLQNRAPAFKDKGRIRIGADADITVFDPQRIIDKATFENPLQYSDGIQYVLVNGTPSSPTANSSNPSSPAAPPAPRYPTSSQPKISAASQFVGRVFRRDISKRTYNGL